MHLVINEPISVLDFTVFHTDYFSFQFCPLFFFLFLFLLLLFFFFLFFLLLLLLLLLFFFFFPSHYISFPGSWLEGWGWGGGGLAMHSVINEPIDLVLKFQSSTRNLSFTVFFFFFLLSFFFLNTVFRDRGCRVRWVMRHALCNK